MTIEAIARTLAQKKTVCFAIARRQVVLEIRDRLAGLFPGARVTAVCQGFTSVTEGDIIVATTHQLYRYEKRFDLLILDEPDAFPFRGNPVLHGIAETACRGHRLFLTATPDAVLKKRTADGSLLCLYLNRRPHGHDLPEPVLFASVLPVLMIRLLHWLKTHPGPRMVFAPTIREARLLSLFLSLFFPCSCCTSKTENRDEVIENFRKRKNGVIVATTVLERGVTIPGADICVFHADHGVFDEASLIQMAGRAGRSFSSPDGSVLFLLMKRSRTAEECRSRIKEANRCAA